jgi:hypothetical protein
MFPLYRYRFFTMRVQPHVSKVTNRRLHEACQWEETETPKGCLLLQGEAEPGLMGCATSLICVGHVRLLLCISIATKVQIFE